MKRPDITRDAVMFVLGVGAFLYASLALMGVASALRGFAIVKKNGGG